MTVTDNSVSLKEYMTDPDKIYYYQVKAGPGYGRTEKILKRRGSLLHQRNRM